jgi:ribose 5-phosphate isomerase B
MKKKIAIGCDHAGYDLKEKVKKFLKDHNYEVTDKGTHSADSVDYPDFAHAVANEVEKGNVEMGILLCGSANGVAIAANRHHGVRAAICWNNEITLLARKHNNANVLCLPSRFISPEQANEMTDVFLNTEFEQGRHLKRVQKIDM